MPQENFKYKLYFILLSLSEDFQNLLSDFDDKYMYRIEYVKGDILSIKKSNNERIPPYDLKSKLKIELFKYKIITDIGKSKKYQNVSLHSVKLNREYTIKDLVEIGSIYILAKMSTSVKFHNTTRKNERKYLEAKKLLITQASEKFRFRINKMLEILLQKKIKFITSDIKEEISESIFLDFVKNINQYIKTIDIENILSFLSNIQIESKEQENLTEYIELKKYIAKSVLIFSNNHKIKKFEFIHQVDQVLKKYIKLLYYYDVITVGVDDINQNSSIDKINRRYLKQISLIEEYVNCLSFYDANKLIKELMPIYKKYGKSRTEQENVSEVLMMKYGEILKLKIEKDINHGTIHTPKSEKKLLIDDIAHEFNQQQEKEKRSKIDYYTYLNEQEELINLTIYDYINC